MKKRLLSAFMALALCLTLLPAPAWAAEADAPEGGTIVQEEQQQEKAPAAESPAISEQAAENGIAAQNGGDSTVENAVAEVTSGGTVTYYEDFHTALNAAKTGDTLTLLTDVKGGDRVTIDKAITFDLNGHKIYALTVECKITLKDSAGGTGKIAEWLRVENGLKIGDLLEEGYAFRKADGTWCYETDKAAGNISVQQVPITSVTLTALNADGTAASTSIPYGTTGGIKLSASCDAKPGAGELSCQWYTIGGTLQLIDGATEPVYQLPADLSVGEYTYRVTFTADGYSKSADITITITAPKIDIAKVPESQIELALAYGGNVPYDITGATNADGVHATTMALSPVEPFKVNGTELTTKDYTLEGNVQYGVGEYTLKINVDTAIYTGSIERTWHVIPRKLGLPGFPQGDYEKNYDGETTLPKSITDFNGYFEAGGEDPSLTYTLLKQSDYMLTNGAFEDATVGKDKRISFTIQLTNKNYEFNTSYIEALAKDGITVTADSITYTNCIMPRSVHFNITPAPMPDFDKEVTLDIVNNHADTYTVDMSALLPKLESPRTYGEIEYSQPTVQLASGYYTDGNAKVENGKLILTIDKNPVTTTGSIGTVTVQVTTTNYKPVTLTVNLRSVNKQRLGMFVFVATDPVVYGMTLGDIKLSAEATVDKQVIPGTIAWEAPLTTVPAAGRATYRWTFTPDDTMHYLTASNTITFLVDKATPTGGGSSSASKTTTTTNADGSVTKTETKKDGTVVETTTGKDGSTTKTETKKDGSSVTESKDAAGSTGTVKTDKNGQTTAETALSSKAIEDAKKSGEAVKAPVEVEASRNSDTAPTVKIELPRNSGDTKVEIPVSNVKPGTVAVLVHPDGTEEIVKNSLPTEDGIQLTINGGATVKIVDNSKDFADTRNHWAKDAIDFVSARGLVNGMSATIYAPNASTTRAQLWTILARQNDADLNGGATWFENAQNWAKEKGISDGANPNAAINRAQMVTMLWRAMGQPATASGASFADVPADSYYAQAVAWAIENGITAGVGGGRFDPNSTCTRAQIVTFLYRSYQSK